MILVRAVPPLPKIADPTLARQAVLSKNAHAAEAGQSNYFTLRNEVGCYRHLEWLRQRRAVWRSNVKPVLLFSRRDVGHAFGASRRQWFKLGHSSDTLLTPVNRPSAPTSSRTRRYPTSRTCSGLTSAS